MSLPKNNLWNKELWNCSGTIIHKKPTNNHDDRNPRHRLESKQFVSSRLPSLRRQAQRGERPGDTLMRLKTPAPETRSRGGGDGFATVRCHTYETFHPDFPCGDTEGNGEVVFLNSLKIKYLWHLVLISSLDMVAYEVVFPKRNILVSKKNNNYY